MEFKLGDVVQWTSQSQGCKKTKRGKIVQIVPAGKSPKLEGEFANLNIFGGGFGQCGRPRESYLVAVGIVAYWPHVKNLVKVAE